MTISRANVEARAVICGAGIAGISAAYHLAVRRGYLFVTADPARIPDFERAAEEPCALGAGELRVHSGGPHDPEYVPAPARGFDGLPTGADLILDPSLIREHFPFLAGGVVAALHVRRCGKMSAQQLGMLMLAGGMGRFGATVNSFRGRETLASEESCDRTAFDRGLRIYSSRVTE